MSYASLVSVTASSNSAAQATTGVSGLLPAQAFASVNIFYRNMGLVATYDLPVAPPVPWTPSTRNRYAYTHEDFPDHVLIAWPATTVLIQRFTDVPDAAALADMAEVLGLPPPELFGLPLRLRLSLEGPLPVPSSAMRGAHVPGTEVFSLSIEGVLVEVRLSASTFNGAVTDIWSELFIGEFYRTRAGTMRASLYLPDLRQLRRLGETDVPDFLSQVLDNFILCTAVYCQRYNLALRPGARRNQRRLGQFRIDKNGRLVADVRLPTATGFKRRVLMRAPGKRRRASTGKRRG